MKKKKYKTKKQKKEALLIELEKALGIVSEACKAVGLSRKTFYDYIHEDENFKASVDEINETVIDYVESKNLQNIKEGDKTSIIFYLKCKAKKRGYIEKTEQEVKGDFNLDIKIIDKKKD